MAEIYQPATWTKPDDSPNTHSQLIHSASNPLHLRLPFHTAFARRTLGRSCIFGSDVDFREHGRNILMQSIKASRKSETHLEVSILCSPHVSIIPMNQHRTSEKGSTTYPSSLPKAYPVPLGCTASELQGPKPPLILVISSSKILWNNLTSNPPCLDEVVVTFMAS